MNHLNKLYQINARPWFLGLKRTHPEVTLSTIPRSYWEALRAKGYDSVWLMGVWDTTPLMLQGNKIASKYIDQYRTALPDIQEPDIIDSCFAINRYTITPLLGNEDELLQLKSNLNQCGLSLILDFVPNHLHFYSDLIPHNLDMIVHGSREEFAALGIDSYQLPDSVYTFFPEANISADTWIAHGRDPYTGSWSDTAQINWFSPAAHAYMSSQLMYISKLCDGVRCDMAMAVTPDRFGQIWGGWVERHPELTTARTNWWTEIIPKINTTKEFMFIAECYWDMQEYMIQSGFDYVYEKAFYDAVTRRDAASLDHLLETQSHVTQSVLFLENHDENRISAILEGDPLRTAIVLHATLPSLKLYYQGQEEGYKIKVPVQIGRLPIELFDQETYNWYQKIFAITRDSVFESGDFEYIKDVNEEGIPSGCIVYKRFLENRQFIIIVNYTATAHKTSIPYTPPRGNGNDSISLIERISQQTLTFSRDYLMRNDIALDLKPWSACIFEVVGA